MIAYWDRGDEKLRSSTGAMQALVREGLPPLRGNYCAATTRTCPVGRPEPPATPGNVLSGPAGSRWLVIDPEKPFVGDPGPTTLTPAPSETAT